MISPNIEPTSFDRDPNDDFSEFVNFEPEDGVFSEILPDLSEDACEQFSPNGSDDVPDIPIIQPPVAYRNWPSEWQDHVEPPTVTPAQLNLQITDKSDVTQLDLRIGIQQPDAYDVSNQQQRDDNPRWHERFLPPLAPQHQRMRTASRHPANIKTPESANAARRRRRNYTDEEISCRRCNIKMETPGELR